MPVLAYNAYGGDDRRQWNVLGALSIQFRRVVLRCVFEKLLEIRFCQAMIA